MEGYLKNLSELILMQGLNEKGDVRKRRVCGAKKKTIFSLGKERFQGGWGSRTRKWSRNGHALDLFSSKYMRVNSSTGVSPGQGRPSRK